MPAGTETDQEHGLHHQLSAGQMTMVAVGGSIGTGPGNGRLIHYDHRTGQERVISVWPEQYGMGTPPSEHRFRFQWTFPAFYSRWDARELWIAGNRVFRSTDEGQSWVTVSPDLTRNDPTRLGRSGGPITNDNTGAEVYCTIFALAESPHERDVLWAGTDDGLIQLSRDRGATWQPITPPELPEWALISVLEPSPRCSHCHAREPSARQSVSTPILRPKVNVASKCLRPSGKK